MIQEGHLAAGRIVGVVLVPVGIALLVRRRRAGLVGKRHQGHRRDYAGLLVLDRVTVGSAGISMPASAGVLAASMAVFCSASIFARSSFCSSIRTSSSSVERSSFEAFLNSPRLLPRERPSSGSLR